MLDVFTPEPMPPGHRLWTTPNLVISPHTSADDPATYNPHSLDIFFDNLRALRDGRPLPNLFDHGARLLMEHTMKLYRFPKPDGIDTLTLAERDTPRPAAGRCWCGCAPPR